MTGSVKGAGNSGNIRPLFDAVATGTAVDAKKPSVKELAQPVLGVRGEAKVSTLPLPDSAAGVGQLYRTEPAFRPQKGRIGLDIGLRHLEQLLSGIEDHGAGPITGGEEIASDALPPR